MRTANAQDAGHEKPEEHTRLSFETPTDCTGAENDILHPGAFDKDMQELIPAYPKKSFAEQVPVVPKVH